MAVVMELADKIAVLVYGQVIANDRPDLIKQNPQVRAAYLGDGKQLDATS